MLQQILRVSWGTLAHHPKTGLRFSLPQVGFWNPCLQTREEEELGYDITIQAQGWTMRPVTGIVSDWYRYRT